MNQIQRRLLLIKSVSKMDDLLMSNLVPSNIYLFGVTSVLTTKDKNTGLTCTRDSVRNLEKQQTRIVNI